MRQGCVLSIIVDSRQRFWNPAAMQIRLRTGRQATGIAGKIFASLFGLVFGSMGMAFMVLVLGGVRNTLQQRSWIPESCVIEASDVRDDGEDYSFTVQYRYNNEGRTFTGTRYRSGDEYRFDSVAEKQQLLSTYAPGTNARCHVNPKDPAQALLERNTSILPGLGAALFVSIFVIIGYGMVIAAWWPRHPQAATIGAATGATAGRRAGFLFCSLFILIGLIVPYFSFVKPLLRQQAARRWIPVEAVVQKSTVKSHSSDDGTTYSVYIAYRYDLDGRTHEGDRYQFTGGSSSGRESKAAVVRQHPVGSRITVYVDPADPAESVILRDAGATLYLGLIPVVFAVFGFVFLLLLQRGTISGTTGISAGATSARTGRTPGSRPPAARRSGTRVGQFAVMTFMALFWNGIVSVFLMETIKEWQSGRHPVFQTIFLTPFVLIGLGLVGGIVHSLLKIFAPVAELEPPTRPLSPGSSSLLRFRLRGNVRRISRLTITLTGREEASYRRGTSTYTDRHVFHRQVLLDTPDPRQMESGELPATIPDGTMHSFEATSNKIIWSLQFNGTIAHWPDVNDEFILNITPNEERA
jgi:hypothetical protein